MNEYSDIKEFIKQESMRLGFAKVGFAKAEKVEQSTEFNSWLKNNYHATMSWMENHKEKRLDPRLLLEDCKTVIVLATNYYNQIEYSDIRISRYVLGDDYHLVIKNKMKDLLTNLSTSFQEINGRCFVDTAPILERYWAQKAGIGWQGKNTNLITRDYGSYVFLSIILLDIELEYDEEHADFCGTCNRCLECCPSSAFPAPYQLDSNKCISYLTIEKRDEFDDHQSKLIENNLYGCDICQEV